MMIINDKVVSKVHNVRRHRRIYRPEAGNVPDPDLDLAARTERNYSSLRLLLNRVSVVSVTLPL
jgi:hypothetical protein